MLPLQAEFVGGGPLALVVTFVLAALFYAVTLHLAALWVLGDEPHQRAVAVSPVPAAASMLFAAASPAVVAALAFLATLVAVRYVYKLTTKGALVVTVFHFAIAVILGFALRNLLVA
jgi:fucose 4-O-acetylase-like acetyltransferase